MLDHKNLRTTQHDTIVFNNKVNKDMNNLKKLKKMSENNQWLIISIDYFKKLNLTNFVTT
jgi:hypothetical protein